MTDYKRMYLILFNAITDSLKEIELKNSEKAKMILRSAQEKAEEIYMSDNV